MKPLRKPNLMPLCAMLVCLPYLALAQAETSEDLDSTAFSYPQVITPTRLKQSLADVPASVTVITADTIRRYGLTSIEEALRLVPGMAVTHSFGGEYKINYHGTDIVNPRRMNVLIDGVSVYHPAFSRVDWSYLPVALEDVDRIEVTRGPNSAAYGPNSMMAVINILTKHPKDVEDGLVSASVGTQHAAQATLRLAGQFASTHAYLTANSQRDSGYDNGTPNPAHDSHSVQRLNLRSLTDLGGGSSLELQASLKSVRNEVSYISDAYMQNFPDQEKQETLVSGKWTAALSGDHEVQIKAFHSRSTNEQGWVTCPPQIIFSPSLRALLMSDPVAFKRVYEVYFKTGTFNERDLDASMLAGLTNVVNELGGLIPAFTTTCGDTDQNLSEVRTQVELQDTYVVSDTLRLVGGMGLRRQEAESDVFFGAGNSQSNFVRWVFGHAEYRPNKALTLNLGGYGESNSLGSDTFSPRLAANLHLSDYQSLRAVYSKGTRTPDLAEVRGYWTQYALNLRPPIVVTPLQNPATPSVPPAPPYTVTDGYAFASFYGNPQLRPERISSREVGYLLTLPKSGLTFDARIFDDRLSNLISSYSDFSVLGATNNGHTRLTGAETQLNWEMARGWSSWLSYAYLFNHEASRPAERSQYSRHSGAVGLSRQFSQSWQASAANYFASGDGVREKRYARTDLSLTHHFSLGPKHPASAGLVASYLHTPEVSVFVAEQGGTTRASFNDRIQLNSTVRVSF